ncbi:hypothetical protein [Kosakonia cowanii]|uniref:hypothetical protein n=1 Tax=Kosakonia cowanii TaxID=208223 RepID=UPI00289C2CC2|nr:hypothetical protein [Kosakonia cowanii]
MTEQLSRERLEKIASWREKFGADHNVMLPAEEAEAMARMLLAGLDSKPVAKVETVGVCWYADNGVPRKPAVGAALYAAAPAPVAVPDELTREEYKRRFIEEDNFDDTYRGGWKDYRAAMLKAGPVTAATVPDGWKLVPVEPTKEMIDAGWSYYMTTKSPSSLGVYGAMLAAAPEQEV